MNCGHKTLKPVETFASKLSHKHCHRNNMGHEILIPWHQHETKMELMQKKKKKIHQSHEKQCNTKWGALQYPKAMKDWNYSTKNSRSTCSNNKIFSQLQLQPSLKSSKSPPKSLNWRAFSIHHILQTL